MTQTTPHIVARDASPGSLRAPFAWPLAVLHGTVMRGFQHIEPNLVAIGLCGAAMFPTYYLVWYFLFPQSYENLPLRLIGTALCLALALHRRWPLALQPLLPAVWLTAVTYAFPFFFTYMLLANDGAAVWLMSTLAALFMMVLLVDWFSVLALFAIGSALAWGAHLLVYPESVPGAIYFEHLPIFAFVLIAGSIFNYNAESLRRARRRARGEVGASVANEISSPLYGIRTSGASLQRYLPELLRGYRAARTGGLDGAGIPDAHLQALRSVPDRIGAEADHIKGVIDLLLINAGEQPEQLRRLQFLSIGNCLDQAVQDYPFASEMERARLEWRREQDFHVHAPELLVRQVLRSLIRVALQGMPNGIAVDLPTAGEWNCVRFQMSGGSGRTAWPRMLRRLFPLAEADPGDRSGLAFSRLVMDQLGGRLTARGSLTGFAELVLWFPVRRPDGKGREAA